MNNFEDAFIYGWEPSEDLDDDCIIWRICVHYPEQEKGAYTKYYHRQYYGTSPEDLMDFALADYKSAFLGNDYGVITMEYNTDVDVLCITERHCNGASYYWFEPDSELKTAKELNQND